MGASMRAFRGMVIGVGLGVLIWAFLITQVVRAATWTENWQSGTSQWTTTGDCVANGGVYHATQQCGQTFSIQRWDQTQPITLTGTVRGQVPDGVPYFCGLVLIQDGQTYAQLAVGRDIAPIWPRDHQPRLIWWANERTSRYFQLGTTGVDDWHTFVVSWDGRSTWSGSYDGIPVKAIKERLTGPLRVDLQGGPQGSGECQFGPLTVDGVLL